jgi:hypothetical protein
VTQSPQTLGPAPTKVTRARRVRQYRRFLAEMRQKYEWGYSFNEHNVIAGKEDAKFTVGNQWDPIVEQRRKDTKKPVLTFNRLIAFVAQIVGNRLMNETEIRVNPDKQGTKEIAEIREGLIRSIFKNGGADFARDEAHKYQVVGGQGAYCLSIDYTSDDVFEQEIAFSRHRSLFCRFRPARDRAVRRRLPMGVRRRRYSAAGIQAPLSVGGRRLVHE